MSLFVVRANMPVSQRSKRYGNHGWISRWGYTVAANLQSARQFESREDAEGFALVLTAKIPDYIGKLEAVPIVAWLNKDGDLRFREVD